MSTSKELVELSELYTNITEKKRSQGGGNQSWRNKGTDKDKEDAKKEGELEKVLTNLKNSKKDEKDDDKEEIKGPNINNNKKSDSSTTNNNLSKTDKEDLKKSVKTYHATDRSGRDFDDPEADSDVRGGQEKKPIVKVGKVASTDGVPKSGQGTKTINPNSDDYDKEFKKTPAPGDNVRKSADYLGKAQGLLDREKWLAKTANSPAAKAGLSDEQRWKAQTKHRKWQQDNNRGAFKVKDNPDTPGNEAKQASKDAAFARRNKRLTDKGLKPITKKVKTTQVEVPSKFAANKDKPTFQRRDQKLLDKGLNPPTYTKKVDVPKVETPKVETPKVEKKKTIQNKITAESYDAYDLVLNYIMESKQASSIEEANYIMMEMDQNTIHEIVQAQKKSLNEGPITTLLGLGAAGYGLWKAGKWAKKKGDKALDGARKNMKIGGENRKDKIEKATGVDLDNW